MTKSHLPRLTAFLLSLLLMLTAVMTPLSADDTAAPVFADVKESDWFYSGVYGIVKTGLMIGTSDTTFSPTAYITTAECITLLARVHAHLTDSTAVLAGAPDTNPWYQKYINYCSAHSLLGADIQMMITDFISMPMSRAQLLGLFSALPDKVWMEINTVDAGAIPDVPVGAAYESAIYRAYRCGITVGIDANGTFNPDQPISRAEVAALITRIVDPTVRQSVTLTTPKIKLYAADGTTVAVTREEKDAYIALGWRDTAYPAKFDAEYMLNEMPLTPTKTGYTTLDNMIDALFAKILTDDMTTYEKVSAVYDHLVRTSTYGRSPVSGKYRPIYKKSPYADPAPGLKTPLRSKLSGYSGYDYFYIALNDHELESYAIMYASEMLDGKTGWCDHYSSAFAVMMRRIGLPAIPLYVDSLAGNTYAPHMTSMMTVGGVDCYFDPQIEAVLVGKTGKNEHKRFCRPMVEMTAEYHVMGDDIAINRALFGTFVYDAEKMMKILKDEGN